MLFQFEEIDAVSRVFIYMIFICTSLYLMFVCYSVMYKFASEEHLI